MNKKSKYSTLVSNVISTNNWWQYIVNSYVLPSGNIGEYHYIKTPGSCMIIPVSNNNTYFMVRQYRYLNNKFSLEFPGGGVKKGIDLMENAKKELIEETGLKSDSIQVLSEFNPFNGVTDEICTLFLAENLIKEKAQPEESEEFELFEFNEHDINQRIQSGEIWDGMTLASWSIYNNSKFIRR